MYKDRPQLETPIPKCKNGSRMSGTGNLYRITEVLPSRANEVERESSISLGLPVDGRRSSQDVEVQSLLSSGELEGKFIPDSLRGQKTRFLSRLLTRRSKKKVKQLGRQSEDHGLAEKRETMMVVSVLIATLTYQASLNPLGGFWPDGKSGAVETTIMASRLVQPSCRD
ncbi:hypothetical protein EJ110_NYTH50667 [Nymphaea thermarum]|nr:hypothetical protein EJ110_NYTH50667 [Nymphaea thermarum]